MAKRLGKGADPHKAGAVRKLVEFDTETWHALRVLSGDSMKSLQELAEEAFADLLKRHGRPATLKQALRESARRQPEIDGLSLAAGGDEIRHPGIRHGVGKIHQAHGKKRAGQHHAVSDALPAVSNPTRGENEYRNDNGEHLQHGLQWQIGC